MVLGKGVQNWCLRAHDKRTSANEFKAIVKLKGHIMSHGVVARENVGYGDWKRWFAPQIFRVPLLVQKVSKKGLPLPLWAPGLRDQIQKWALQTQKTLYF